MKLQYWTATCLDDSHCYNIRERTKKAAVARRAEFRAESFSPVFKVEFEYDNALDLLQQCLGECGAYWESPPESQAPVAHESRVHVVEG